MNNLTPPEGNLNKKLQYFAKFETEKGDLQPYYTQMKLH